MVLYLLKIIPDILFLLKEKLILFKNSHHDIKKSLIKNHLQNVNLLPFYVMKNKF